MVYTHVAGRVLYIKLPPVSTIASSRFNPPSTIGVVIPCPIPQISLFFNTPLGKHHSIVAVNMNFIFYYFNLSTMLPNMIVGVFWLEKETPPFASATFLQTMPPIFLLLNHLSVFQKSNCYSHSLLLLC